jgi:hypothetical protein
MSSTASPSGIHIRRATAGDADICGRICYDAFAAISHQHNFPLDFPAPEASLGLMVMLFSHPALLRGGRIRGRIAATA